MSCKHMKFNLFPLVVMNVNLHKFYSIPIKIKGKSINLNTSIHHQIPFANVANILGNTLVKLFKNFKLCS